MKLKKAVVFLLVTAISLTFVGCSTPITPAAFTEEQLTLQGNELSEKLASGDFDAVVEKFSKGLKSKLPDDTLEQAYVKTIDGVGEYVAILSTDVKHDNSAATVDTVLEYENNGIKITYTFNPKMELDGIWINYEPLKPNLIDTDVYSEIEIKIGDGENKVDGILTLPKTTSSNVAILVQGSGQSDMNETIGSAANVPFKDIAHGLAQKGISTIRYNKRYYQFPETAPEKLTIEDEVLNDVAAAIAFAQKNDHQNFSDITIIGHSLGGMLAPKIASDNSAVTRIISLAGSPRRLEDIILMQNADVISTMTDKSDAQKDDFLKEINSQVELVKKLEAPTKSAAILGLPNYYWFSLNQIDTESLVKSLTIPMLFLQGEADFQVKMDEDFGKWKEILGDNSAASFISYPNLNHIFMQSNGKTDVSEYNIKSEVDKKVIDDMASFITVEK